MLFHPFQILEKQVLTVAKAFEDKIYEEISALDRLENDDLEALRERRLQQMKKMAKKRSRWIGLGHGNTLRFQLKRTSFQLLKLVSASFAISIARIGHARYLLSFLFLIRKKNENPILFLFPYCY